MVIADGLAPNGPLPRGVAVLLHTVAALIWAGVLIFYVRVWLGPSERSGELRTAAQAVVDGTALAPFQYRVLVPQLLMWADRDLGWPVGFTETVIDVVALAIGVFVLGALLRRLDLEVWVVPVALYGAFVMVGMLWWGKFETVTAFGAATVATWAILCNDRRRWVPLAAALLVMSGTRTDLMLATAVALLARWLWAGRERRDLVAGVLAGATGVVATVGLKLAYADATYGEVSLLQLTHNAKFFVFLTGAAFLLPALGPYLLIRSQPAVRAMVGANRSVLVPMLALVLAEVGSILVVGRVEEVRLFVPITGALAIVGVCGWRALLGPYLGGPVDGPATSSSTTR